LLLRFTILLTCRTHFRFALSIGWILAWFSHYILRYRVDAAEERIGEVFKDLGRREVKRMAWRSWRDFVFNVVELYRLPRIDDKWIERHVVNHGEVRRKLREHCGAGRGAVVASPHMGAAEAAGVVMQRLGVPVFMITGKQTNPLTDPHINKLRGATGIETVQKGSSLLRSVIRKLKQGGVLTFLADLRVAPHGVIVRFLGREASVAPGMALFARQAGVPIIPIVVTREGWAAHRMELHDPVMPDPAADKREDQRRMTQEVFDVMTDAVRKYPEQWFWYNKRWILEPVEEGAE
jgi:KDO2-lipid IV(A) lauroyltransferase